MKLTIKQSIILIIAGGVISVQTALPMIINHDDSFLTAGAIISTITFVIGTVNIIRVLLNIEKKVSHTNKAS